MGRRNVITLITALMQKSQKRNTWTQHGHNKSLNNKGMTCTWRSRPLCLVCRPRLKARAGWGHSLPAIWHHWAPQLSSAAGTRTPVAGLTVADSAGWDSDLNFCFDFLSTLFPLIYGREISKASLLFIRLRQSKWTMAWNVKCFSSCQVSNLLETIIPQHSSPQSLTTSYFLMKFSKNYSTSCTTFCLNSMLHSARRDEFGDTQI